MKTKNVVFKIVLVNFQVISNDFIDLIFRSYIFTKIF